MEEVVRLNDLTCLAGNHALLSHIDWSVKKGEHWVVFGLNGSGKTTLLSIIAGFRGYTSGSVNVFGSPYTEENILEKRKRVGWISSSFFDTYYQREAVLNIVLSGISGKLGMNRWAVTNDDIKRAKSLLIELGLKDKMHRTFDLLSKGERQNVLIARALISDPELLILDEPGTGLDVFAREYMLATVRALAANKERTIIYVTHYTEEILDIFDKCLLLRNGKIYATGPSEELFTDASMSTFLNYPARVVQAADHFGNARGGRRGGHRLQRGVARHCGAAVCCRGGSAGKLRPQAGHAAGRCAGHFHAAALRLPENRRGLQQPMSLLCHSAHPGAAALPPAGGLRGRGPLAGRGGRQRADSGGAGPHRLR